MIGGSVIGGPEVLSAQVCSNLDMGAVKVTGDVLGSTGSESGSTTGGDNFGFVAENIGSFKVKTGTTTYSLVAGNSNDDILLTIPFSDTRLNEI